ncbi:MAG: ATP-binding protein [Thermomicrobiales bacterium]
MPLTSLIGREHELASLTTLLRGADVRLVTLTGTGGMGKTRLALEAGARLRRDFGDGVVFVDLTPLRDADLVIPTIAGALGVRERVGQRLLDTLARFLAPKQMLLLLDNCEQVLGAAPEIAALLVTCPRLSVLATSREALHVRGEREFELLPLPLPQSRHLPAIAELASVPAVTLFVERASASSPGFTLTTENATAVAAICRRLDGLPLAIELGAARSKMLPPAAMLTRLEQRLSLLTGGSRNLPARQRTMRDAIAWSFDLLTESEQALFRRLAVFVGGWTLEGAEAVSGGWGDFEVLAGMDALTSASLVQSVAHRNWEWRFAMLETVREYGLERLAASGEEEETRRHHAEWCLALAERAEPRLLGPEQGTWLGCLEAELDNLRAAFVWAMQRQPYTALRLAAALYLFWQKHGHIEEGSGWLDRALAQGRDAPVKMRAAALLSRAGLAAVQGDFEQAVALGEEGLVLAEETGDEHGVGWALAQIGGARLYAGQPAEAVAFLEQAVARFTATGNVPWRAMTLDYLGLAVLTLGDSARAAALYEEALALQRTAGETWATAQTLSRLGELARRAGRLADAAALYGEGLDLAREHDDHWITADCLTGLARVATASGEVERAARLFGAAEAHRWAMGVASVPLALHLEDDPNLRTAHAVLGEGRFLAAWQEGRAMPPEEVIAEAAAVWTSEAPSLSDPSVR